MVNPRFKQADAHELLRTKLTLPRLRTSAVAREGLLKRLDDGLERKLTLISAPAGFGKTTLVSEWAARLNQRYDAPMVAWVSLDAGDNDPVRFWRYVITACQRFGGEIGVSALAQLHIPRQPSFETMLTSLINDLSGLAERHVLVLEDYHFITLPPIHDALTFLLDHLPAGLHLVIMTRSDPPIPLARLRARDDLNELHAGDLRFSADETVNFLQQIIPFALSGEVLQRLEAHIEGWVAGLQIAALALQGRQDKADVERFLDHFSGSNRHILDYLAAEVLAAQPPAVQTFLLQTSFLSRLTADLCDAVTGRQDSAAMLERLERANLFLVPLDGSQQWYRYHALFAEAMQHYAGRHLDKAQLDALYQQASLWYEQHDMLYEAVEIALTAGAFERAAVLIEQLFNAHRYGYEIYTLRRWTEALPDELLAARPLVALMQAIGILFGEDRYSPATKAHLEKPLKIAEASWHAAGSAWGLGAVLALRSMAAFWQGDIPESVAAAGQSLELLPENDEFWRSISLGNMAYGELAAGNLGSAHEATQESRRLFAVSGNAYGERAMIFLLGELSIQQGDLRQAAQFYRQIVSEAGDDLSDRGGALFRLAGLAYEWNDLETAEAVAAESLDIAERQHDEPMHIRAALVLAQVRAARGAIVEAREILNALVPLAKWPLLRGEVLGQQARLALLAGDLATVRRWYTAQANVQSTYLQREQDALTAVRMLTRQGLTDEALNLLDQLQAGAPSQGRNQAELEITLLRSLAYFAQNRLPQAKKYLLEALKLGKLGGYQRLFLNEGEAMAALLKAALPDVSDDALITTVRSLLYAFRRETAEAATALPGLPTPLSPQEQRVLSLIAAGLSYPQMADELVVSINTIKTQVKSIYRKLNVESRDEARDLARHLNLV